MTDPTGIDQSWGYADPKTLAAKGVQVVAMYLSHDPSKNMTPAKARAYFAEGIDVLFNWEAQAGAPLLGWHQGHTDAVTACAQAKAIMLAAQVWPVRRPVIYFSCDTDANPITVEPYYIAARQVCHDNGFGLGVYGSKRVVEHLAAQKITDAEWQTFAWSGGQLSPDADFYQYRNGQRIGGAQVDFDRVIHFDQLGSWGPNAYRREHPSPTPKPPPQQPPTPAPTPAQQGDDDDMGVLVFQHSRKAYPVWVCGSMRVVMRGPDRDALIAAGVKQIVVSDARYATIRKGATE